MILQRNEKNKKKISESPGIGPSRGYDPMTRMIIRVSDFANLRDHYERCEPEVTLAEAGP
jgi:hypothetical protein